MNYVEQSATAAVGKLRSDDKMEKLVPNNGHNHLVRSVIHYIWRQSAHAHVTKKLIAITRVCAPSVSPPGALHLGDTGPWRTSAVGARRHWRGEAGGLLTADWHNLDSDRYSVVSSPSGRSDAVTCLQPWASLPPVKYLGLCPACASSPAAFIRTPSAKNISVAPKIFWL